MPSQKTTSGDYTIWTGVTENVPNVPGVTRGSSETNVYSANLNVFGNLNIRGALDYTLTGNTEINDQYLTVAANNNPIANLREGGVQFRTSYGGSNLAAIRFYEDANGFASTGGTWQWTPNVVTGVWYNFAVGAANANGSYLTAVVQDPAPQLGGNLDTLDRNIFNSLGGYVSIFAPNGLIPSANASYDLGAVNANYWRNLYLSNSVNVGGIQISRPAVGVLRVAQSGANANIQAGGIINGTSNIIIANSGAITITPAGNTTAAVSITNSGNVVLNTGGNISASYIYGNGRFLTGLPEVYSNANVAAYLPTYSGNLANVRGNIGNVINTGNVNAGNAILSSNLQAINVLATANVSAGNVIVAANTSAGNSSISANLVVGDTANILRLNIGFTGGRANLGSIANIGIGNAAGIGYGNGQVIYTDGAGGLYFGNVTAAAAGATDYVQYNSGGALAADPGFTRNATSNLTQITGVLSILQAPNGAANIETVNINIDGVAGFSNIGNIAIPGGSNNFAIVTDGTGNLRFANVAVVPGGANLSFQYNNAGNFAGATGFTYDPVTANITVGNISAANLIADQANVGNANVSGRLDVAYANIITLDVSSLNLPATGTFTAGNVQLSNPNGNIIAGNVSLNGATGDINTTGNVSANSIILTGDFTAATIGDSATDFEGNSINIANNATIAGNLTAGNIIGNGRSLTGIVISVTSANASNITVNNTDPQNPNVDFAGTVVRSIVTGNSSQITIGGTTEQPNVSIAASGVTGAVYGNASIIPVITVAADGRITNAVNTAVSLSQTISNTAASSTLTIPTQTLTITGTTNQVTSTLVGQTFTLSTPQDIATTSLVQFGGLGVGTAAASGEVRATGNIIAFFSDDRLKTRLGNIENALDKIDAISTFYFEPNETALTLGYPAGRFVGVSAQDTQAQLPEIVADAPLGQGYLTVMYEKFAPLMLAAIKELRAEIEDIKRKL